MKTRKQPRSNVIDNEFPLLPVKRQMAILKFLLEGAAGDEVFFKGMSHAELRFYRAVIDVIDAYGPVPEERLREIIRMTPLTEWE
jgi:hypothetical protein